MRQQIELKIAKLRLEDTRLTQAYHDAETAYKNQEPLQADDWQVIYTRQLSDYLTPFYDAVLQNELKISFLEELLEKYQSDGEIVVKYMEMASEGCV